MQGTALSADAGIDTIRQHRPARTAYPDYANPELLEKIPLAAHTILDVGCAQGALGMAYLRRNPLARVLGIDSDEVAIRIAGQRLTEIACLDVEATPMPFAIPDGINCIIYGDVLEHLADPWKLLARHAESLTPDGTVLVCMPNVEHWRLAQRLLNGSFDYEDTGLLDRTHLRWFTPRSMGRALAKAGLELADLSSRPVAVDGAQAFTKAMAPGLRAIGVDPQEYFDRAWPLQYIWRARRASGRRIFINATALPPLGGVSEIRVVQPLRALRGDSAILGRVIDEARLPHLHADIPHIAVLHRPLLLGEPGISRIKALLTKGYVIVSEFDDHPSFIANRGIDIDQLLTFKGVHAVQTSTDALADVLRQQNPELTVFPNAVFELPEVRNFTDSGHMTLFFGALNRENDWAPLLPALNEVAQIAGARLQFSVVHDKAFFDALATPHKQFTPTCDHAQYLQLLASAEIAFMPLADTAFNRAKSDLKFIEAAACRVAALASNVVYGGVVENGKTGLLFADMAALRTGLLRFLADPEAAKQMADAARRYVASERMLAYQVPQRTAWYQRLWENRAALNQALRLRMPALFEQAS